MLWRLLRRLSIPAAWLGAAVFALHPVNVESVAWITERKNVLVMLFSLLSLLAWRLFADLSVNHRRAWPSYLLSLALFALALFSKTTACTLPAALLLILWFKRVPITAKRWLQLAPYVLLGLAMGLLTVWWEHYHQGTGQMDFGLGPIQRIVIASRALWFYLGKLIWPVDLAFSYTAWKIDITAPRQYLWLSACLIVTGGMWFYRRRIGRGPIAAMLFFVATLFPMLGFFTLYTFYFTYVADHYQYFAAVGPITLAVALSSLAAHRLGRVASIAAMVAAVVMLATLGILTWRQCHAYRNAQTIWRDTIAKNPDAWMARNNLGIVLQEQGQFDEAISQYRRALQVKPDYEKSHFNLAVALKTQGKLDEALHHFRRVLHARPHAPDLHVQLGSTLQAQGRLEQAIEHYRFALQVAPDYAPAHDALGIALHLQGHLDQAIQHYRIALQLAGDSANTHHNLAIILDYQGKADIAAQHYRRASDLRPDWPESINGLAWLLATDPQANPADVAEAIALAQRGVELADGRDPSSLDTLAAAYAAAGQFDAAVTTATQAVNLATDAGDTSLARQIAARLALYQQGKPYYQTRRSSPQDAP